MPGQIVIVTGTSGSGKSTACELFARRSDEFWLLYGIDHFMAGTFPAKFGHHGPRSREGVYAAPRDPEKPDGDLQWKFGPNGTRAFATFHEWIAAASRAGCNIIVDHLLMADPPLVQDMARRLADLPVLIVTLKPSFEVLTERVNNRQMDKKLPDTLGPDAVKVINDRLGRLRPWFYEAVYADPTSDLMIDTVAHGPEEFCEMIERQLGKGPGTALDELRRRYPPVG